MPKRKYLNLESTEAPDEILGQARALCANFPDRYCHARVLACAAHA
ncbi:MAG: hypothetical protein WA993_05005 [Candidatus Binatus sp.]